jgi:hypothetical protein
MAISNLAYEEKEKDEEKKRVKRKRRKRARKRSVGHRKFVVSKVREWGLDGWIYLE